VLFWLSLLLVDADSFPSQVSFRKPGIPFHTQPEVSATRQISSPLVTQQGSSWLTTQPAIKLSLPGSVLPCILLNSRKHSEGRTRHEVKGTRL
jgi:hypothetical protein